jgi:hypothetical protein
MSAIEDRFHFITSGIVGLSPIPLMIIPLIIGIGYGFLLHKLVKIAIIAANVVVVAASLGFFSLNIGAIKDLSITVL